MLANPLVQTGRADEIDRDIRIEHITSSFQNRSRSSADGGSTLSDMKDLVSRSLRSRTAFLGQGNLPGLRIFSYIHVRALASETLREHEPLGFCHS